MKKIKTQILLGNCKDILKIINIDFDYMFQDTTGLLFVLLLLYFKKLQYVKH